MIFHKESRHMRKETYKEKALKQLKVMQEVGAKHALAVHWGTFERLTDESLDEPPRALKKVLDSMPEPRPDFRVLAHGQTWKFD